jgi:CRISPR system Cascade subunit CasD
MARHLLLRLRAPLIAFGGETIDNFGVIRDFPAQSMLTGMFASALGYDRSDDARHNRLQARLVAGARLDVEPQRLQDFQTAELGAKDRAWTTWGSPEERGGGAATYAAPHLRYRDYLADMDTLVALRLEPADEAPTLDDLAQALDHPLRPLFIGRKPCLPMGRLHAGWVEADTVLQALSLAPWPASRRQAPVQWPHGEGELPHARVIDLCDERNWTSGVHGGWRPVCQGQLQAPSGQAADSSSASPGSVN